MERFIFILDETASKNIFFLKRIEKNVNFHIWAV